MKSRSMAGAGRTGWVLLFVALSVALPSGQQAQAPHDAWSQLRDVSEGARVKLTFHDGSNVTGRVMSVNDDAVVLKEIRTGSRGIPTATGASEQTGYPFSRTEVRAAELLSRPRANLAPVVAGSFDQLRMLVAPGQKLSVTDLEGRQFSGTIAGLTTSTLDLKVNNEIRQYTESTVAFMRQRRDDSLRNGALWGLAVGAGAGLTGCGRCHVQFLAATAGIGAGIGAGIDALIRSDMVIFKGLGISAKRVAVRPVLAPSHRSVQISIAW